MHKSTLLLKNTSYLMLAEAAKPVLSFALVFLISRRLGQSGVGEYTIVLTFAALFELLATAGLGPLLTRTIAADRSRLPLLLNGSVGVAMVSTILIVPSMLLVLRWMNYPPLIRSSIQLLAVTIVLATVQQYVLAILEGLQNMRLRALVSSFDTIGKVGLGVTMILCAQGVSGVVRAYLFTRVLSCLIAVFLLARLLPLRLSLRSICEATPYLLRTSLPFLCMTVASTVFWSVNTLMLSKLGSTEQVGSYNAGYRIMDILKNLLYSYFVALLPAMSASFATGVAELRRDCDASFKYLALVTLPLASGISVLASRIVVLVYGPAFGVSGPILALLAWSLVPFCLGLVFARVLIASHNQVADLYCNIGALAANVVAGSLLIPRFGPSGAAVATVVSLLLFVIIEGIAVHRTVVPIAPWSVLAKASVASLVMAIALASFSRLPLFFLIPVGFIAYMATLLLIGTFSRAELRLISANVAFFSGRLRLHRSMPIPLPRP